MRMRENVKNVLSKFFYNHVGKLQFNERSFGDLRKPVQSSIDMVKLLRVYGGCLGVERR
jgi:hypothetical protein